MMFTPEKYSEGKAGEGEEKKAPVSRFVDMPSGERRKLLAEKRAELAQLPLEDHGYSKRRSELLNDIFDLEEAEEIEAGGPLVTEEGLKALQSVDDLRDLVRDPDDVSGYQKWVDTIPLENAAANESEIDRQKRA